MHQCDHHNWFFPFSDHKQKVISRDDSVDYFEIKLSPLSFTVLGQLPNGYKIKTNQYHCQPGPGQSPLGQLPTRTTTYQKKPYQDQYLYSGELSRYGVHDYFWNYSYEMFLLLCKWRSVLKHLGFQISRLWMLTKLIPCFLQLIHELEFLLEDTPLEQLDESTEIRYQETIVELQNILLSKIDESTVLLLKVSFIQPCGRTSVMFMLGLYYFGYFQQRLTCLQNRSVFG